MLFSNTSTSSMFPTTQSAVTNNNPNKDVMIASPPEDTVTCMEFSPACMPSQFLAAGGWSNNIQCWEVQANGNSIPKAQQSHTKPILDCCWSDDGSKIFTASCDNTAKMWDLASNQTVQVAQHDAPIKTCHFVKSPNYSYLVTGSWDKTLKFWDLKSPTPIMSIQLPEKCLTADVKYPLAVVGTSGKQICIYSLEDTPKLFKQSESPLKFMHRTISIFNDKKTNQPCGYTLGSIEGRVAIQFVSSTNPKDSFTFKCHRSPIAANSQEIYAVNDMAFHPVHGTLATVGSDGKYSFWDKDARTKLKTSEDMGIPITSCCFNAAGTIFSYATGYDWGKGHAFYDNAKKTNIYFKDCFEDLKSNKK